MQMQKDFQESRINPIIQLSKHYYRRSRGVTRLDGTRGKTQVWRSHCRTWSLSEENLLYWRKCLWHCWDFWASPLVILCPLSRPRYASAKEQTWDRSKLHNPLTALLLFWDTPQNRLF